MPCGEKSSSAPSVSVMSSASKPQKAEPLCPGVWRRRGFFLLYSSIKSTIGVFIFITDPGDLGGYRAFKTFFEQVAAVAVNTVHGAGGVIGVGGAAARAVKARPAVPAFLPRVNVAGCEFPLTLNVFHAVPYVAQAEFFIADELMAGVEIALRRNG